MPADSPLRLRIAGMHRWGKRIIAWGWCDAGPAAVERLEFESVPSGGTVGAHVGFNLAGEILTPTNGESEAARDLPCRYGFVLCADLPRYATHLRPRAFLADGSRCAAARIALPPPARDPAAAP